MRIRKQEENPENERIRQIARVSDALAHPARIALFRFILKRNIDRVPVRNKDLVAAFSYAQATISQHMNKLVTGELIQARQEGTSTFYYANIGIITQYVDLLRGFD